MWISDLCAPCCSSLGFMKGFALGRVVQGWHPGETMRLSTCHFGFFFCPPSLCSGVTQRPMSTVHATRTFNGMLCASKSCRCGVVSVRF